MNTTDILDVALRSIPEDLRDEVMMGLAQTDPVQDRKDACGAADGDWLGTDRDGNSVWCCKVCGEPREYALVGADGKMRYFPIAHRHDLRAAQAADRLAGAEAGLEQAKRECYGGSASVWRSAAMADVDAPEGVRNAAGAFLADKEALPNGKGLIVCGKGGVGKSFLAAAMCNDLLSKGKSCRFVNVPQMVAQMEGYGQRDPYVRELARNDLVVLDDLGSERDGSYIGEMVFLAVDALYTSRTSVIVTTNLTAQQIAAPGADAKRVLDRLKERSRVIDYRGANKRQGVL